MELARAFEIRKDERRKRSSQIIVLKLFQKEAAAAKLNPMISASLIQSALEYTAQIKNIISIKKIFAKSIIQYQSATTTSFGHISTEIDRREIFESIDEILESATDQNIFFKFIKIFYYEKKENLIQKIKAGRREFVFQSLFSTTKYDHRNRVSSKFPPLPLDRDPTDEEIWPYLIEKITFMQTFSGQHQIPYALYKISLNFRINYTYLESLISKAWIVPTNLTKTCAKAIHFGFNGDFTSFLYISTPLYEALLRNILIIKNKNELKQNPNDGSQEEPSLKYLLENIHIRQILGEDLQIHLRALLIDEYGIKLRHNLSHGLFDDNADFYTITFYSFLVFNFLIFSTIQQEEGNGV
ncbi:DUF4209 domain-containing protein [Leptospira ognonensis]|uniref:DUF4209 domain-containing protein n=1 Tax=Leptospira ognonensis TaxID=2484945 RepID=A0A4R9JUC2_9LEPT|nr:DUF4209 domain-containing protein [Leptospira ognonensis]